MYDISSVRRFLRRRYVTQTETQRLFGLVLMLKYLRQDRQSKDVHSLVGVVVSRGGLGEPQIARPALHVFAARQALRLHRILNYFLRRFVLRNKIAQLLPRRQ